MKLRQAFVCAALSFFTLAPVRGAVTGAVRGDVEDPDRRPVPGAAVVLKAVASDYSKTVTTNADGTFEAGSLPVGMYQVTIRQTGFAPASQNVTVLSGGAPVLHFRLALGPVREEVNVRESAAEVSVEEVGPVTMVSRDEIGATPGAALSNSLNSITAYVPGATVTHDQLHVRGGHQVTWAIDGVPIPNTNIASNVGPQIDPKDVDYLEAERGGYSAAYGDRTFGVFNVIPRTGFEGHNTGELFTTFGTFHQTNDQVSFGSHTDKFAYFGSINGNRSDYGLETPGPEVIHDRVWGLGGMGTLVYNRDAFNQFRFVTTLRRDDYQVPVDGAEEVRRDAERERDGLATFSWLRTMPRGVMLSVSPFYHQNRANYDGAPEDFPVSPTQHRDSRYAGAQVTLSAVTARHNASAGVYGFLQRDTELVALAGSELSIRQDQRTTGGLSVAFLEDQFKPFSWLTLNAGARLTHFTGTISENAASPRFGAALPIPHLNWTVRGFWGRYYQAPPLSTVSGPLLDFALSQGFAFIPLQGERDRETQFGVSIPLRGWSLDMNHYHQSARNYFDHNAIAGSNVFFPLTIDRARLRGWEASLRSPRLFRRATLNLTYAHAYAEGAGAISGGLTNFSPHESGYFFLDHDQRDTFRSSFDLVLPLGFSAAGALYYGSGFTNGESEVPAHLPGHTTFDGSVSKLLTENFTLSVIALNAPNRRFLLDNSETFGGTHYADPRQIYVQVRYRFHY